MSKIIHGSNSYQAGAAGCAAAGSACSPELVIRGETDSPGVHVGDETAPDDVAHVDWLAFTVRSDSGLGVQGVRDVLHNLFRLPCDAWQVASRGWMGYQERIDLGSYGLLAHGGERQRGTIHVELNAHACYLVADWQAVRAWGETIRASITRVDLAHDDFEGGQVNIEMAKNWYEQGGFNANGRPPRATLIDDFGSGAGKTLRIGARQNGKFGRFYEKGREQGDPDSPWFRVEVEWRNKSRCIPWDALTRPGEYLAGAYPCLRYLSTHQDKVRTLQKSTKINYDRMVTWVRTAAGRALNVMVYRHRGDVEAVMQEVIREGVPKRLVPLEPYLSTKLPDWAE